MNKMKWPLTCLSIGLYLLVAISTNAQDDELPRLSSLVPEIIKASVPANPYHVTIIQTIAQNRTTMLPTPSAPSTQSGQKPKVGPSARSGYVLHFSPLKGIRSEIASLASPSKVPGTSMPPADARLAINIPNFLKRVQNWPTNSVVKEALGGKTCFKVSSRTSDANIVFWVDAKNNCIVRVEAYIRGSLFAESSFEYQRNEQNGWLLSHAETSYAGDGNHVLLDYGAYDFSSE